MFRHPFILVCALLLAASTCATARSATNDAPRAASPSQASSDNAESEVQRGLRLMKNKDPADEKKAVVLFRKAAAQRNTDGEWNLGAAYVGGRGVPRDMTTGLKWMRDSLSDGSAKHMFLYGAILMTLGGDKVGGMKWLHRSAEAGSPSGMMFWGITQAKKHPTDARHWMLKSAETGFVPAQTILGEISIGGGTPFGPRNPATGVHWLREAAERGGAHAAGLLATLFITGRHGVHRNAAAGVQLAGEAIAQHNPWGYYALGLAYQKGRGEPADPAKAWYNFAVAQRLDTKHQLTTVSSHMSVVATKLSVAEIDKLQAGVAKIPVPKKKDGGIHFSANNG